SFLCLFTSARPRPPALFPYTTLFRSATASVLCGAAAMLPFALADLPTSVGWKPLASVVVLGIVGTGFAQLIVNRLIGDHGPARRSEEHTSELQSHLNLVCRLLLEKKK